MTIVEFLEARIAEDEAQADSGRALREVAAKRALIDKFGDTDLGAPYNESPEVEYWEDWQVACYDVLINLASIYSEHPDYRKEWELKRAT